MLLKGEKMGLFALGHFVLSGVSFVLALSAGWRSFDTGAAPTLLDRAADGLLAVCMFPLVTVAYALPGRHFEGLLGWLPFVANSALWGIVLYVAAHALSRRRASLLAKGV
jgi:hypothetical protein